MRRLDVVDFTYGRRSSDDVNTSLPFTENFKECRTIQQANVVIGAYVNKNIKDTEAKQNTLVSGENIKTINNESILGEGNISIQAGASAWGDITGDINDQTDLKNSLDTKQDTLIGTETTGQNIKTINGNSILGTGNLSVTASTSWGDITGSIANQTDLKTVLDSMIPGNEVKQSGIVVGHEIIDDLYIGNYGNIKETDGTSSFYNCPTVVASEPLASDQLANKGYVDTELSEKQDIITGGATTITSSNLTASRVLVSNSSGKVAVDSTTTTDLTRMKNDSTFSNSEVVIGTWFGKPLYRKSYQGTFGDISNNTVDSTIKATSNELVDVRGSALSIYDQWWPITQKFDDNNYTVFSYMDDYGVKLDWKIYYDNSSKYNLVVEYTKKSD